MDAQHTGELGFDSLLRHFFKNFNQHLALQGLPDGQTVCHPPSYDHKPVVKQLEKWWTIRYNGKVIPRYTGQFLRWFIHAGPTVWWTIRKWIKQPWIIISIRNRHDEKFTNNAFRMYCIFAFKQEVPIGKNCSKIAFFPETGNFHEDL